MSPTIANNHPDVVEEMLDRFGRDPDERMPDGSTPLIYSVSHGYVEMVKILLQHGAKMDAVDKSGQTALDWAQKNKSEEILSILNHYQANSGDLAKHPRN